MAMIPVYKPPDGEVTAPVNGMFVGKSLYVFGKIAKDADKFVVDLMCGDDVQVSVIALQLNPRFPAKEVVRNTRRNGVWGEEERAGGFPFTKGDYFSFKITCNESHFLITANDASFTTYEHRVPFSWVTHVRVGQKCQAILITSEIKDAEIPAVTLNAPALGEYLIPFYNVAQRKIQIVGFPNKTTAIWVFTFGITINLMTEDNQIIFHNNPRLNEGQIIRNTRYHDEWGTEERSLEINFPFQQSVPFQTTIIIKDNEFVVDINGVQAFTYKNRVPGGIALIRNLQIGADVKLERITYF